MRLSLALILAAAGLSACAPTGGAAPVLQAESSARSVQQCFTPDRVMNFRGGNAGEVYLRVHGGAVFAITSAGCPEVNRAPALALSPITGVNDRLCVGDTARITGGDYAPPRQCQARVMRSLTEAEIAALPSRQRP